MTKTLYLAIAACCALVMTGFTLSRSSTFVAHFWKAPHLKFVADSDGRVRLLKPVTGGEASLGAPRAKVDEPQFDFGRMDPLTMGSHVFVVRNEGDGPLTLRKGPTTCKCTLSRLAGQEIPPGGEGRVELEWNTGRHPNYSHSATIYTNDPTRKEIQLGVAGRVRVELGAEPSALLFSDVDPLQSHTQKVALFSQLWDGFTVESGSSTLEGVTWTASPLHDTELKQREAKSGSWLSVTLPTNLPSGELRHVLHLVLRGPAQQAIEFPVPIQGRIGGRLVIYGEGIDAQGNVHLGALSQGHGLKRKYLVRVRDDEPTLSDVQFVASPSFIQTQWTLRQAGERTALYELMLTIPADTPPCTYARERPAVIQIRTGHPRVGDVDLRLEFYVIDERQ